MHGLSPLILIGDVEVSALQTRAQVGVDGEASCSRKCDFITVPKSARDILSPRAMAVCSVEILS